MPGVNIKRTLYKGGEQGSGPVVYWMSREQRAHDNWALLYAQEIALERKVPLIVTFCLFTPNFLGAPRRMYEFMIPGLKEAESELRKFNIPFYLLTGNPAEEIPKFLKKINAGALVTDFMPLKISRQWKEEVRKETNLAYYVVDAHNIVPCWVASQKQEFGAYTIRPKITKLLPEYIEEFPALKKHPYAFAEKSKEQDFDSAMKQLKTDASVPAVDWIQPGEKAGKQMLARFVKERLSGYDEGRNDPAGTGQSDLSPYFHFGQLAPQRAALEAQKAGKNKNVEAFLEELIIRRELSDNYCFYNKDYDNFKGFPDWARQTLDEHRKDKRSHLYSKAQFENAQTHDPYWNAAQLQLQKTGKLHGYMRMYWAKKILEWTPSPEDAQAIAIYLNDKYELDGRDPNGYTGVAWSIGGVHDRAWTERPVFGKIRFMNDKGLERKFEMDRYVALYGDSVKIAQKNLL